MSDGGFVRDEEIGRINIQFVLCAQGLSRYRIKRGYAVDHIVPELDAVGNSVIRLDSRKDIHRFAFGPETSPFKFQFVIGV